MKPIARFCPSLAILMFLVSPVFAQNQYRFELFGAGDFPQDKSFIIGLPQFSPPLDGIHKYSPGARGGLRFGVDFKKHWGEDIIYSFGANASKIVNSTSGAQFPFTVKSHQFALNALWYPIGFNEKKKVSPYLTAGVGVTYFVVSPRTVSTGLEMGLGELRTDHVPAFNAGGGIRAQLTRHFGYRLEARDYMSRPPRYGMDKSSQDPSALVFPVSGVYHKIEVSFAFVYFF